MSRLRAQWLPSLLGIGFRLNMKQNSEQLAYTTPSHSSPGAPETADAYLTLCVWSEADKNSVSIPGLNKVKTCGDILGTEMTSECILAHRFFLRGAYHKIHYLLLHANTCTRLQVLLRWSASTSLLTLYQPMTPFGVIRFWTHVISWRNPFWR